MDYGHVYTNKEISKLQHELDEIYKEAESDIRRKMDDFNRRYEAKEKIYAKQVEDGKISQEDFDAWKRGQVFQGEQWRAKHDQIIQTMHDTNRIATDMINGKTSNIFAVNANYMSYDIEHKAKVDFGFGIYDNATVTNLIKNDPHLLPEWKIDEQKDYIWNNKKVNRSVTQGIIQGESLDKIADRLCEKLVSTNENKMKTFARTAMTGAQNAGRMQSLRNAKNLGIDLQKEWMATLDAHTRDSHKGMDTEKANIDDTFSNGLMYPGDPRGAAKEVYNCRCTMVSDVKKYPAQYKRYDNIDGKPIENMSYRDWYKAKYGKELAIKKSEPQTVIGNFQSRLGAAKTVDEINALMNSQNWFRSGEFGWKSEADLTGCDLDSAKSIAASYEQIFEKYPTLVGKFDAPNAQPVNMGNNTYAWCYIRPYGKVQVNPKKYDNWSNVSAQYERDVRSGWHPYGTTAESIVTHEVGHAIDGLLAREGILGGVTSSGEYRYASSTLKNTIMNRAAKMNEDIAEYWNAKDWRGRADKYWQSNAVQEFVSEYATKNNREWFAECFAEYITSANPRIVAAEFGKELEKLLGKLK